MFEGANASVFGTNSTSNKPADLWELFATGGFGNLYEVTCKPVNTETLNAAVDSFAKLGLPNTPITFVCRVPTDCATLDLTEGAIEHRGVPFQFLDFASLVEAIFVMLTAAKRLEVFQKVGGFVAEPVRKQKTKRAWAKAFG